MQVKSKIKQVYKELNGEYILVLQIPPSLLATIDELKDKDIGLTLEKYSNPKSMRAHRYMWSLIGQLAKKLRTDQLTIYRRILTDYSPLSFNLGCDMDDVWKLYEAFRVVIPLGDDTYQCYLGESHFTQDDMRPVIDGLVNECKEQGIPTRPQEELESLIKSCPLSYQ